jgi:hypothetical protein
MILELGLHRRRSLYENYPDPAHRSLAIRVFWCIYVLDRRWSFGTGLSFALIDRDLNPPEPVSVFAFRFLHCGRTLTLEQRSPQTCHIFVALWLMRSCVRGSGRRFLTTAHRMNQC